jgi:hypothetical protein
VPNIYVACRCVSAFWSFRSSNFSQAAQSRACSSMF